jgi:hypothetical protein
MENEDLVAFIPRTIMRDIVWGATEHKNEQGTFHLKLILETQSSPNHMNFKIEQL